MADGQFALIQVLQDFWDRSAIVARIEALKVQAQRKPVGEANPFSFSPEDDPLL